MLSVNDESAEFFEKSNRSGAGGFLLKDAVLLGTALWALGESVAAVR